MAVNTLAQASSSPLQRILRELAGPERARAAGMIGFIGALHIVGWGLLLMVAGGHHQAGAWAFGIGTVALVGIIGIFRRMRHGDHDEATLEEQLANRGLLNRILGRVMRAITKPWQMYPVGVAFGVGFDTVTEVALLIIAGSTVAAGLPWYAMSKNAGLAASAPPTATPADLL